MMEYHDPYFGYAVKYPCFFQKEDTSLNDYQGYARFSFTDYANVVLESYKPAMPRLFKLIEDWRVLGAY